MSQVDTVVTIKDGMVKGTQKGLVKGFCSTASGDVLPDVTSDWIDGREVNVPFYQIQLYNDQFELLEEVRHLPADGFVRISFHI
jgi:hypothetical protein